MIEEIKNKLIEKTLENTKILLVKQGINTREINDLCLMVKEALIKSIEEIYVEEIWNI